MPFLVTITSKNQLTIPKQVSEDLGLGRKALMLIEDEKMIIQPLTSKVEQLAGSLAYLAGKKPVNFRKIREVTRRKVAEKIAREGF